MKLNFGKKPVENPLRETVDLLREENALLENRERELLREAVLLGKRVEELEAATAGAERAARFREGLAAMDFPEERMAEAFKATDEGNALWCAVLTFLDKQAILERDSVCAPGLTDEGAQFNRGRLAMAVDLKDALVQVWAAQRVES